LLGKPIRTRKSHGLIELTYAYQQFEHRQMTPPFPIVGIGPAIVAEALAGKRHLVMEDTIILIGKDGKVVDIKGMSMEHHGTGLFVKDDSPKAEITKVNLIRPGITTQEQAKDILGAPPFLTRSQTSTNQMHLYYRGSGEIKALIVVIRQDGIVDEVKEYFKEARFKRVDTDSIAQIKELISRREDVESILDRPSAISHTPRDDFYLYCIKEGGTKEELYIQYDSNGLVASLTRKLAF
jgi:hypothetical protein